MNANEMMREGRFLDKDLLGEHRPPSERVDCEQVRFHDFYQASTSKDLLEKCGRFYGYLYDAKQKHQYLYRRTLYRGSSARVVVFDVRAQREREMIMMASNSYLDLTTDPRVVRAADEAQRRYGYGSGGVALLSGTYEVHRKLEATIAECYGREDAVVFPTGYAANLGTLQALLSPGDLAILDMYSHASLVDGTQLAGVTTKYFRHNDVQHLEELCRRLRSRFNGVLIAVDGVFSMDGDVCPLPDLSRVAKENGARLLIDEAHAIGTIGPRGLGTEDRFGMIGAADIIAGTLSKAPGGLGGYVAGSHELVEYLRHFARSHIFSTSLPPPVAAGLIEAFHIIRTDEPLRQRLGENARYFARELQAAGFETGPTQTPIVPLILGDELLARRMTHDLHEEGIFASAVVYPAVARTGARVRFSVMATHTREDLDYVISTVKRLRVRYASGE
ncbi:MAG: aminotransferase class I/II-fold pyridoxal phosphate-dependent enzyme [Deltaproteobacteria bacterium]|nr:aminotransferase class I/II-fold pyridoxal phosphate-dependent enzyme [Deltaproteobacteria bacterium]